MPYLRLGDQTTIHYRLEGIENAPVLVFSNSLGSDLSMWESQACIRAKDFRVLRYDARGQGLSSAPPGPYSIEMLGRDVIALLDGLRLPTVAFCGLSMGGAIGMWLGANAAERIEKLILCNTSAKVGNPEAWKTRMDAVQRSGIAAITEATLERWFTPRFRAAAPEQIEQVRRMLLESPPTGYLGSCAALRDMDQRELLSRITAPTLVIAGSKDQSATPAEGKFLAANIAGAKYVELDAAHLSNIEQAGEFTAVVDSFLRVG